MAEPHRASRRPIEVGLFLTPAGTTQAGSLPRWANIVAVASHAEAVGYDSIWIGDHLLLDPPDHPDPLGAWEAWSLLAALAASTRRIELGPMVLSAAYRNPALIAKMADTVDEISGGRLVLGLGTGWWKAEFESFGFPFDHRASRFEEALEIITRLLRGEEVTFDGQYHHTRGCLLTPRGPRPHGPPILIGGRGPRLLRLAATYASAWDSDFIGTPDVLTRFAELQDRVDAACHDVGRDPDTLARNVSIMVNLPGHSRVEDGELAEWRAATNPASGTASQIAEVLLAYAEAGASRVHVWLDPATVESVEAFGEVLAILDSA